MFRLHGGCYCGNLAVDLDLSGPPEGFRPRACDCDFCGKHGAAYLSDPEGSLSIRIQDPSLLGKYRQGTATADFLFCLACAVLVGVTYRDEEGHLYAAVNSRVMKASFGEPATVSPKELSSAERHQRWKQLWFSRSEVST